MLEVGIQAPDFTLLDKEGTEVTLSNILKDHSTVVLYFYPKDSTAGCTKQACGSVSYTHLDVYKRQIFIFPSFG